MVIAQRALTVKASALVVLSEIALGVTTPKHLALSLGKSPPAIMKQLNYLRKTGWIKRGEKEGKFQHYEINWDEIIPFFLSRAPRLSFAAYHVDSLQVRDLIRRFSQCERFKQLFIYYLMERSRSRKALVETLGFYVAQSVPEVMENFEESLMYLLPRAKWKLKEKEDEELFSLLKKWTEIASKYVPPYRPLELSLKNLGLCAHKSK